MTDDELPEMPVDIALGIAQNEFFRQLAPPDSAEARARGWLTDAMAHYYRTHPRREVAGAVDMADERNWHREEIFADIAAECERQEEDDYPVLVSFNRDEAITAIATLVRNVEALDRKASDG